MKARFKAGGLVKLGGAAGDVLSQAAQFMVKRRG